MCYSFRQEIIRQGNVETSATKVPWTQTKDVAVRGQRLKFFRPDLIKISSVMLQFMTFCSFKFILMPPSYLAGNWVSVIGVLLISKQDKTL